MTAAGRTGRDISSPSSDSLVKRGATTALRPLDVDRPGVETLHAPDALEMQWSFVCTCWKRRPLSGMGLHGCFPSAPSTCFSLSIAKLAALASPGKRPGQAQPALGKRHLE